MNDKKQIEEMANTYYEAMLKARGTLGSMNEGAPKWYAKAFYEAGYRKQKAGRWVHNEDRNAYEAEYFCSECLADGNNQGDEPFCWNCGAYMKGGAE